MSLIYAFLFFFIGSRGKTPTNKIVLSKSLNHASIMPATILTMTRFLPASYERSTGKPARRGGCHSGAP